MVGETKHSNPPRGDARSFQKTRLMGARPLPSAQSKSIIQEKKISDSLTAPDFPTHYVRKVRQVLLEVGTLDLRMDYSTSSSQCPAEILVEPLVTDHALS